MGVAMMGSGTAQAAAPSDCGLQRDAFSASAQCPVGGDAFYDLTVDCWGLNWPFGGGPAIGPYSYTVSTLASGPNVTAHCAMGAGITGVVTNAYITPRDI
ncbi:hypothetical protein FOH10_25680 [Nocardia otitidiscaviarum]|uniref:Uncharacterized protein n=2 Tax=Nocardia otitidiscaviarum TaxID=1823 RepID=A0A516NXX3_9NOCA|nr:hypothetical protein FOH10_25680 [Nocardia otitidiscaviarum]